MKKIFKMAFIVVFISLAQSVKANEWSIGLFLGQATFDELNNVCDEATRQANVTLIAVGFPPVITCDVDDSDTAAGINLAYNFTKNWGVELGYVDLGDSEATVSTTLIPTIPDTLTVSADALYLAGVGTWHFNDNVSVSGRFGAVEVSADLEARTFSEEIESDTELMVGVSLDYRINDLIGVQVRYDQFDEYDVYGAGIKFHF